MEARAVRKHIRSSPRKMRTVVNALRCKRVGDALSALHFLPQKATRPIEITIQSAVYNLLDKFKDERIDENELIVREIRVDDGPRFKRFQAGPRGRARPIIKRSSHLTVVVASPNEVEN